MDLYTITTISILPLILLTIVAGLNVQFTFRRFGSVPNGSGRTGAEIARALLDAAGLERVRIAEAGGTLTDNYDPRSDVLSLSRAVRCGDSVSAAGVAAHEVGHAVQKAEGYAMLRLRSALAPVCGITSRAAFPLLLIGMILEIFLASNVVSDVFFFAGVACYGVYTLFALITLPVELDASRRARRMLVDGGFVEARNESKVRKVLTAAALTYVASFALSLVQLLRIFAIFADRRH